MKRVGIHPFGALRGAGLLSLVVIVCGLAGCGGENPGASGSSGSTQDPCQIYSEAPMESLGDPDYISAPGFELAGVTRVGGVEAVAGFDYTFNSSAPGVSITDNQFRSGEYSGEANIINSDGGHVVFRLRNFEVNQHYRIAAHVKGDAPVVMSLSARHYFCMFDDTGNNGGMEWIWDTLLNAPHNRIPVSTTGWTESVIFYTYDEARTEIYLDFSTEQAGKFYIDDIEITEVSGEEN